MNVATASTLRPNRLDYFREQASAGNITVVDPHTSNTGRAPAYGASLSVGAETDFPRHLPWLTKHVIRLEALALEAREEWSMSLDGGAVSRALELLDRAYAESDDRETPKVDSTFITPIYDGELQLEWAAPGGRLFELEVRKDGRFRFLHVVGGNALAGELRDLEAAVGAVLAFLRAS